MSDIFCRSEVNLPTHEENRKVFQFKIHLKKAEISFQFHQFTINSRRHTFEIDEGKSIICSYSCKSNNMESCCRRCNSIQTTRHPVADDLSQTYY